MFAFEDLRKTQYFLDVAEEERENTKKELVPRLQTIGLSLDRIAKVFQLDIEKVRETAKQDDLS